MARVGDFVLTRRLLVTAVVAGLFILFDLAFFGWLIFRSLSEREIERVLLETREEVEGVAEQIAARALEEDEGDLYTVVAQEQETRTYLDAVLTSREIVEHIEIRDAEGVLVFKDHRIRSMPLEPREWQLEEPEVAPEVDTRVQEDRYEIRAPIGELGFLNIGISQVKLQQRIETLRTELVRQATFIGALTVALLAFAYAAVAWLWRRGRRLQEKAAEAERMAYIGILASGLAHEIRNPLNSLSLNMQMLEEELPVGPDGSRRRLLGITRSEIGRLERLVTDFLTYARPRALELEELPALELLEDCRQVLAAQIQAQDGEVRVEDRTAGASLRVDASLLKQLLLNLLQNALQAAEDAQRRPRVMLSAYPRDGQVVLEVADNGPGIPPEERERIFDLFYSTRKGGTGLGLAIAERIARAHDGRMEVETSVGAGTRVRVVLPAASSRSGETGRSFLPGVTPHSQMSSS